MPSHTGGQDWLVSWHPDPTPPPGTPHGSAGICVSGDQLVLISPDGTHWGFPGGRPEGTETYEDTLRREMREEACVVVERAKLLGFAQSECVRGWQRGETLVRSYWLAEVRILPWQPEFEIQHRRIVPAAAASDHVRDPDEVATRISHRALTVAGLAITTIE
jgi:ADP-ribose pyrophosphatase YjhB (NUDIX family)